MSTPTTSAPVKYTPAALRLAAIIIPEGIDRKGRPSRIATTYGLKTREGIADLIDRESASPDLLAALDWLVKCANPYVFAQSPEERNYAFKDIAHALDRAQKAINKAEGRA